MYTIYVCCILGAVILHVEGKDAGRKGLKGLGRLWQHASSRRPKGAAMMRGDDASDGKWFFVWTHANEKEIRASTSQWRRRWWRWVLFHCTVQHPPRLCGAYGSSFLPIGPHTDGTCERHQHGDAKESTRVDGEMGKIGRGFNMKKGGM